MAWAAELMPVYGKCRVARITGKRNAAWECQTRRVGKYGPARALPRVLCGRLRTTVDFLYLHLDNNRHSP